MTEEVADPRPLMSGDHFVSGHPRKQHRMTESRASLLELRITQPQAAHPTSGTCQRLQRSRWTPFAWMLNPQASTSTQEQPPARSHATLTRIHRLKTKQGYMDKRRCLKKRLTTLKSASTTKGTHQLVEHPQGDRHDKKPSFDSSVPASPSVQPRRARIARRQPLVITLPGRHRSAI